MEQRIPANTKKITRVSILFTDFNIVLEVLATAILQEKVIKGI